MDYELVLEKQYSKIAQDLDVSEIESYILALKSDGSLTDQEVSRILNVRVSVCTEPRKQFFFFPSSHQFKLYSSAIMTNVAEPSSSFLFSRIACKQKYRASWKHCGKSILFL